jgi:hypothetical protein
MLSDRINDVWKSKTIHAICEVEVCPAGKFSNGGSGPGKCVACLSGTWGAVIGATSQSAACSAACSAPAGSYCGPGETSPTGSLCSAGTFGSTPGLTSAGCSGSCTTAPGSGCPAGSTSSSGIVCDLGRYSTGGSMPCTVCPSGTFGSSPGLSSSGCSGNCLAGYACPSGSTNSTSVLCPAGTYSLPRAGSCTTCSAGTYSQSSGSPSLASCVLICPDTTWSLWLDTAGVEGVHSCYKRFSSLVTWQTANDTCLGLAPGAHLLTSRQVPTICGKSSCLPALPRLHESAA